MFGGKGRRACSEALAAVARVAHAQEYTFRFLIGPIRVKNKISGDDVRREKSRACARNKLPNGAARAAGRRDSWPEL